MISCGLKQIEVILASIQYLTPQVSELDDLPF